MIDLDELLNGNPTPEQVTEFLRDDGDFCGEQYLVQFIKKYCRDAEDRKAMESMDISIEEMLNGQYAMHFHSAVDEIFAKWNKKVGHKVFGSGL